MNNFLKKIHLHDIWDKNPWPLFLITVFIISLVVLLRFSINFPFSEFRTMSHEIDETIVNSIPEEFVLEIENGVATATGVELPFYIGDTGAFEEEIQDYTHLAVVDTNIDASLGALREYNVPILIARDAVLAGSLDRSDSRLFAYEGNERITREWVQEKVGTFGSFLERNAWWILLILGFMTLLIMSISVLVGYLVMGLIVSLLLLLVTQFSKKKKSFEQLFMAVLYVLPIFMLVNTLVTPFISLPTITIPTIILGIISVNLFQKKQIVQEPLTPGA